MTVHHEIERIRFSSDHPDRHGFDGVVAGGVAHSARARFLARHVRITPELLPDLYASVSAAVDRLVPDLEIHAFVSADESLNAVCIPDSEGFPTIWVSSGIAKLLSGPELCFVIGHEIGHWCLGHHNYPQVPPDDAAFLSRQALARAAELSADRAGLVACQDVDTCVRGILKVATGLPEEMIRLDVSSFLDQLRELKGLEGDVAEAYATHPPMVVRARAVIWFSMSDAFERMVHGTDHGGMPLSKVDEQVEQDLREALGRGHAREQERTLADAMMWLFVEQVSGDGTISRDEQSELRRIFGDEICDKLVSFLGGKSSTRVRSELRERSSEAVEALKGMPPTMVTAFVDARPGLRDVVGRWLNGLGL
jgi:peptidase M48-like protein